jgi:hypothetical protein
MKRLAVSSLLLALALGSPAPADAPPAAAELVQQLGDSSYAVREDAAARLARMGRAAAAALEQGLASPDLAVRRRCAELLPLARRDERDILLDDFVAGGKAGLPLPGWRRFRELAGDDLDARRLYVDLLRADRPFLELWEKDAAAAVAQAGSRLQALAQRLSMPRLGMRGVAADEAVGLLLAAALAPPTNTHRFYQICNICYQAPVHGVVRGSPAARRLLGRALAPRLKDRDLLPNAAGVAVYLGLTEFLEERVKPAARTYIASVKPDDHWRFSQAVYLASQLRLDDVLEGQLKPAIRQQVEALARRPDDQSLLFTTLNLVQTLQMEDSVQAVLRPAVVHYLQTVAANPADMGRIYSARYLSQSVGLNDAFDELVKPAACRLVVQSALHLENRDRFQQAIHLAQYLGLEAALEGALRPAGRRRILADLEQGPTDPQRLVAAAQLAQQLRLSDVAEDTLKPLARRLAGQLGSGPADATRIFQVHSLAQALAMPELNEAAVRPALRQLLQATGDRTPDEAAFSQTLQLARSLRMKEAVPLAVRGALAGGFNSYTRSSAILFVGDVGSREDVGRLAPLLKDTTSVGTCGVNSMTLHGELRDVALAALVFASGQSLADYGFPYFQLVVGIRPSDTSPSCMGFASAADREAALKKWQQWSATRKK